MARRGDPRPWPLVALGLALSLLGPAPAAFGSDGWSLATERPAAAAATPAYLGNGYVGTRIPADFAPRQADAVRVRLPAARLGGQNPRLAELTVR
jgi:hypothetical protein